MPVKTRGNSDQMPLVPFQKLTTSERDGLDLDGESMYIIYNTTTVQLEYTVDGINWLAV